MIGWAIGSAIAAAAAAFVAAPLLRKAAAGEAGAPEAARDEIRDLESQRRMTLDALRDLEDDRATGKMGESDYRELRGKLVARGARILERLDTLGAASGRVRTSPPEGPPAA